MRNCAGIIISAQQGNRYGTLSETRPDYMLPFGGRYRVIDFALSNMANYDLSNVMLYAGKNVRSTLDHIADGKNWGLNRRNNGLLINPPSFDELRRQNSEILTYFDSLKHFEAMECEHIYIENPMYMAKVNINEAYHQFMDGDYDVLLPFKTVNDLEARYYGMHKLILDNNGQLINIGINLGTETMFNLFLSRVFIKAKVFIDLIKDAIEKGNAQTIVHAILNNKNRLKIGAYEVKSHVEVIRDTATYYQANMNLLDHEVYREMFYKGGMVYTKSKDEPSALYKETANARNSLIANGCMIEGQVENSIIFRGVHIHKNAIVRNCILFQKTEIGENAVLINAITDKYSRIGAEVTLVGSSSNPYVVAKNELIGKNDQIKR